MAVFPSPVGGASLVLSFRLQKRTVVIVGSNALAASRALSALEADSRVVVLAKGGLDVACEELRWRAEHGEVEVVDFDSLPGTSASNEDRDAAALDAYLAAAQSVAFVIVTDTVLGADPTRRRSPDSSTRIAQVCKARNIPVNVTDMPALCDFSFTSTHRFTDPETGALSSLQVGVTTNGQGCRLAGRVRRDIVTKLPKDVGAAVAKVGQLRALAKASASTTDEAEADINEDESVPTPNRPVPQRASHETIAEDARRRMRWVAQVSEYWPISRLAKMTKAEMEAVLDGQGGLPTHGDPHAPSHFQHHPGDSEVSSLHSLSVSPTCPPGRILLVGSGPGHPALLTVATRDALTKHADLVLSDKLVPDAVLALIPSHVEVRIARKFPGNADGAQNELMEAAVEAARQGRTVVRLKQGDPSVYGRAGEEVLYFRAHGFEPVVIPGVSSVLAGPTFAGIPVTQRGAAESFVVCTGVGRQGKEVTLPGYVRSRTLVLLMGVARLPQILETLQSTDPAVAGRRDGASYPPHLPIALIERASMPDQRVIVSTLRDIAAALESVGEQRPPGMLVIGWSILSLWEQGDVSVLEQGAEEKDEDRLVRWLGDKKWRITEGLEAGWEGL
ncbi:uroporphyrin-III C-methyltransferase [Phanerochaete sordida]|uniref:precorrin-2 dehydrogenase n=1 Tax=Phanerochaete sordida TaxID=48140 RepID=A0A9P3LJW0_9APHY|nr:uroporphyrin-III C-methyltransferase [Phanerochaete sordida]